MNLSISGGSILGQDDNKGSVAQRRDSGQFPLLINYMCQRSGGKKSDQHGDNNQWTFRDILDRMISITIMPVKQTLKHVSTFHFFYVEVVFF